MPDAPEVVAVINTSEDTTDMLRTVLERAGYVVVTGLTHRFRDGKLDFEAFIREHEPSVIVYDIAIPYEQNWALFQHFRSRSVAKDMKFVLTTTNVVQLRKVAGTEQHIHEIVGKPFDLNLVVEAVVEAVHERPRRLRRSDQAL